MSQSAFLLVSSSLNLIAAADPLLSFLFFSETASRKSQDMETLVKITSEFGGVSSNPIKFQLGTPLE